MARLHVDEVNVHAVDAGHELREGVQLRLALPPVVLGAPVANELLELREPRALRLVGDRLPVGPPGRREAPAQIRDVGIGHLRAEGADRLGVGHLVRERSRDRRGCDIELRHDESLEGSVERGDRYPGCAAASIGLAGDQ